MPRKREPKIYATLRRRFDVGELARRGFTWDGSQMVKRGACRVMYATATSHNGLSWLVTPLVRHWR